MKGNAKKTVPTIVTTKGPIFKFCLALDAR